MPITPTNPFKGRHYPGEVIVLCVRWYLRYPLAYEHVSEILAELGVEVDASCIWRWVQAYAPELNKRCRTHLKPTNKSDRIHETYIIETYIKVTVRSRAAFLVNHAACGRPSCLPSGQSMPKSRTLMMKTRSPSWCALQGRRRRQCRPQPGHRGDRRRSREGPTIPTACALRALARAHPHDPAAPTYSPPGR